MRGFLVIQRLASMSDQSAYLTSVDHKTFSLPSTGHRTAYGLGFSNYDVNTAKCMMIQPETENIRITYDGTTPTAAIGYLVVVGSDPFFVYGANIQQARMIAVTGTAVIQVDLLR